MIIKQLNTIQLCQQGMNIGMIISTQNLNINYTSKFIYNVFERFSFSNSSGYAYWNVYFNVKQQKLITFEDLRNLQFLQSMNTYIAVRSTRLEEWLSLIGQ